MVKSGSIKGWKKHLEMTMNLIVPLGMVRFVFLIMKIKSIVRTDRSNELFTFNGTTSHLVWISGNIRFR